MGRTGLTRSFGAELRQLLALSAKSRLTAFASGLAVTGALQSGTATTLIITSFAAQGLVTGAAALAIILGADVGTTIVVQLLSFGRSEERREGKSVAVRVDLGGPRFLK